MKASPVTRMGWHKYYVDLFNKTDGKRGEHLAIWFLLLHLAFDEQPAEVPKQTRKEKAQELWTAICHAVPIERAALAAQLVTLKKESKVSWLTLGLNGNVIAGFLSALTD